MPDQTTLTSLAFRLQDLKSLRTLVVEGLDFDFADKPVDTQNWTDQEKEIVVESKIIAEKNNFFIYYIQTDTDSVKLWKSVATKIIKEKLGQCLVCSHNPDGFNWVFSSLSKEFSKSFSETRHIPIKIKPNKAVPTNFVEFLRNLKTDTDSSTTSIQKQVEDAFDNFTFEIHEELTLNVFEALKTLSKGIIEESSNKLSLNDETLKEIRPHIFTLLYRLVFILFAEDRGIFPNDKNKKIYHEKFSLKWIKEEWLLKSPKLAEYQVQKRLQDLFKLIELGSEAFDYPKEEFSMRSYYGRIFDRQINSKLEEWKIPNENLSKALSLITRTKDNFFLDYAALETRHLGAVYENLLEFHLKVKNKKIEAIVDTNERKNTASYYTPKNVVDNIAENSIGPLIDNIINKNSDKQIQIEKIFDLKIVDPAMGSGHFIVGAVEYVAKRICEIEFGEITEQNYIERKRDVVRSCVFGVDLNPLAVDLASLSLWLETLSSDKPLTFLSSHLKCGNSLVGSEIESIFGGQSTLFESTGGRIRFKKNIKNFLMFENMKDDTPSAVKVKLEEYNKMQSPGTIYKNLQFLLNCKTAESFGMKLPILFNDYSSKIGENSMDYYLYDEQQNIDRLSTQERFFHWELEFPQIFYDENGNKKTNYGFDCIIGNPPYIRQESITEKQSKQLPKKNRLGLNNFEIPSKSDLSCYFYCHSLNLLKENGILGFIASDSWMNKGYGVELQKVILNNCIIHRLFRTEINEFKDADTKTARTFFQKSSNVPSSSIVDVIYVAKNEENNFQKKTLQHDIIPGNWKEAYFENPFPNPKIPMITLKSAGALMRGKSTGNNEFFILKKNIGKVASGQKTGNNEYFVLDKETIKKFQISDKYVKPVVDGDMPEGLLDNNNADEFLLDVNESKKDLIHSDEGKNVLKYIEIGEKTKVPIKKGKEIGNIVLLPDLKTLSARKFWYSLNLDDPPAIFLGRFAHKRMKFYENNGSFVARDNFAFFTPPNPQHVGAFLAFFSSSWFALYMEKNGDTAGGGALQFLIIDYKKSPVPDFGKLSKEDIGKMNKAWKDYRENFDREELDKIVLKIMGFNDEEEIEIKKELEMKIKGRTSKT